MGAEEPAFVPLSEIMMEEDIPKAEADRLREAEKWFTVGGGSAVCSSCRYEYEPEKGDCPICGVGKNKFTANDKVVAGFAENQTYGLGTNSWTEGQKLAIIYGSIAFFVFVFLSGYLLG